MNGLFESSQWTRGDTTLQAVVDKTKRTKKKMRNLPRSWISRSPMVKLCKAAIAHRLTHNPLRTERYIRQPDLISLRYSVRGIRRAVLKLFRFIPAAELRKLFYSLELVRHLDCDCLRGFF